MPIPYRLLTAVTRDQQWQAWLLYMLEAVTETAQWTTRKIAAVHSLIEHTAQFVREHLLKVYSHELIRIIFEQPYCRIHNVVEAGLPQRQTASGYLKKPAELGVLHELQAGKGL